MRELLVCLLCMHTYIPYTTTHTGLYNLRGSDVSYNPVFFSYAIVTLTDVRLYIDEAHLTIEVTQHLSFGAQDGVQTFPYSAISTHISELLQEQDGKVWIDSHSSQALCALVPKTRRVRDLSPIQLLKGVKNTTEIEGMKSAHVSQPPQTADVSWSCCGLPYIPQIRDGAAVCEYLAWLDKEVYKLMYVDFALNGSHLIYSQVGKGELNEVTAADKLEELRQ